MTSEEFIKSVKSDISGKEYRPELVLVAYRNDRVLFVKSARSDVWNLPQEGIKEGEKPRDAFLRGWLEEICHINISYNEPIQEQTKEWAENKYFTTPQDYHIFYVTKAETPGRSRGGFSIGKKYYFVSVLLRDDIDIISLSDNVCPEEISDIELVNMAEAHYLMIGSSVAIRKRHIVDEALRKLASAKP